MTQTYKITKTEKQKEAVRLIGANTFTLLEGGGRSGKTFIALFVIIIRCIKYPGSLHLVVRFRFSHAKQAICYGTMPVLLKILGLYSRVTLNKTDWFYEFPNGSQIWIGGIDDKDRTEKILGNEYATIFTNEASQLSYNAIEILMTRLNPPHNVKPMFIIDYNPPSITHWGYLIFHKRQFPDGRPVPADDFVFIHMNPGDNLDNISPEYLKNLEHLSEAKRRRFLHGEYSLDSGKLWRRAWIPYWPDDSLPDFLRVVVGVDPSGTLEGDEIGIVVCGQFINTHGEKRFMVIDDYSCHGTPAQWAQEVAAAYNKYRGDLIVAEKNYGGLMVESTIKNAQPGLPVKLINSSRGKIVRAEPISVLYEHGESVHRIPFMQLEDEMCTYDPELSESPNRMDAMVFAMTELSGEGVSMLDVL